MKEKYPEYIETFRKQQINISTLAETEFKKYLDKNKIKYSFQKVFNIDGKYYIVDFYFPSKKLVIEIDGGYHFTKEQKEKDSKRTKDLKSIGLKVIRLTNDNVMKNNFTCLDKYFFKRKCTIDDKFITYGKYKGTLWKYLKKDHKNYIFFLYENNYPLPNEIKQWAIKYKTTD